MIDIIKITNSQLNMTCTFDKDNSEYLLDNQGVSIQELKSNYNTYSVYGRVGKVMDSPQLSSGIEITITGWIIHTMMTPLDLKKQFLLRFFNPTQPLELQIIDRIISGYCKSTVKFGTARKDNNEVFCKFQVTVFCPYPSFSQVTSTNIAIQGTQPNPYIPPEGYISKSFDSNSVVLIDYPGNLDTGFSIQFNIHTLTPDPTWTNNGVKIQQLQINPATKEYSLTKILHQFSSRDLALTEQRMYVSEGNNPGWYSFDQNENLVSEFTEINLQSPEFIYLNPGINAIRITDLSGEALSCRDVYISYTNQYSYPKEEW